VSTITLSAGSRRAYFEALAERWDDLQPPDRGLVLRRLLAPYAGLFSRAGSILEVGTGTGALIPCLREVAPDALLFSIDLAQAMVERARLRCPQAALAQADAQRLPFARAGFDLVVCHNAFPHFEGKERALAGLALALRPGGGLLVLHDLSRERVNAIHRGGGEAIRNDLLPPGTETERMLTGCGFTDVEVEDGEEHYLAVASWPGAVSRAGRTTVARAQPAQAVPPL